MLYRFLKVIIRFGIRLFYKEIKLLNKHHLDHDGPTILVANHPNTLMDAWMVGYVSKRPVYFMAKATFFSSPFKKWLLGKLFMIPVNRSNDSKTKGVSNSDSFEACYELMEKGGVLAIFPEGSSFQERRLREIKSGAARIALGAQKRNKNALNLKIIPIGIFYSDPEHFRSQVLIHVGAPIPVQYDDQQSNQHRVLSQLIKEKLEQVIPTPTNSISQEKDIELLVNLLWERSYFQFKTVSSKAKMYQELQVKLDEMSVTKPYLLDEIMTETKSLIWKLHKLNLPYAIVRKSDYYKVVRDKLIFGVLMQVVLFPLVFLGFVQNIIPYLLTDFILMKKVKEVEYHAALGVLLGFIFYPLNYYCFTMLVNRFVPLTIEYQLMYWSFMVVTGLLAYSNVRKWKFLVGQVRWYQLLKGHQKLIKHIASQMQKIQEKLW